MVGKAIQFYDITDMFHKYKNRSPKVFCQNLVLNSFAGFAKKLLCQRLLLKSYWLIKKRLRHKFFPVNSAKFLRSPILKNICK